jgi:hypothetical protein
MQIGARYNFEKAEVYWPQDSDSAGYSQIQDLIGDPEPTESGIVPEFQAAVSASADLDILVTPEVSLTQHDVLLQSFVSLPKLLNVLRSDTCNSFRRTLESKSVVVGLSVLPLWMLSSLAM